MPGLKAKGEIFSAKGIALAGILANAAGSLLYRAQGPDSWQTPASLAGAFFLFFSYLCSQLAWGDVLASRAGARLPLWERFFFGSAFFALLLSVLGFLPIVGASAKTAWSIFLCAGCLLSLLREKALAQPATVDNAPSWGFTENIAALIFSLGILGAFTAHPFWDSLWYHLTASRLWFEQGRVYLPPAFPVALKTGLWDYHFLLGQILLGDPAEGGGLIAAQLFGQWAAFSCVIFSFLVLRDLSEEIGLSTLSALAGVIGTELFVVAEFAKNDWAAVFWGLCALAYALKKRSLPLAFGAAGLCFSAKYSSSFFLLLLLAWQGWEWRRQPRQLVLAFGAFVLAALPLLARNYVFTRNPFFPALQGLFPNDFLGPSWSHISLYEGFTWGIAGWREKITFLLRDSKAVWGLLALPFVWAQWKRGHSVFLLSALSALIFLVCSGPKAEWRLAGACIPLLAAFGARAAELVLHRLPGRSAALSVPLLGFSALLLFPVDWRAPQRMTENPVLQIRSWVSGSATAWIRLHADPQATAATLNEQRIYYLFPHPPRRVFDDPALDRALARTHNASEAVQAVRKAGIRYLILSAEFLDHYYDRKICDEIYALSEQNPKAVVFRSNFSRVLDLELLESPHP
jgi:hypothetical protein